MEQVRATIETGDSVHNSPSRNCTGTSYALRFRILIFPPMEQPASVYFLPEPSHTVINHPSSCLPPCCPSTLFSLDTTWSCIAQRKQYPKPHLHHPCITFPTPKHNFQLIYPPSYSIHSIVSTCHGNGAVRPCINVTFTTRSTHRRRSGQDSP
jgi:hypothetical protein